LEQGYLGVHDIPDLDPMNLQLGSLSSNGKLNFCKYL